MSISFGDEVDGDGERKYTLVPELNVVKLPKGKSFIYWLLFMTFTFFLY